MILLLLLQLTIDSAIEAHHNTDYEKAYQIAFSISTDTTDFYREEILELRAYTSIKMGKFEQADSLFQIVTKSEFESIRYKAFVNYAELQRMQFRFKDRLMYLQKAYNTQPTNQVVRIISRHYFQIEADYDLAERWLERHTIPETAKDSSGYFSTLAQLHEAKRQYEQAIEYYSRSKISAKKAGWFANELFASEGLYRSNRILEAQKEENMVNLISWLILSLIGYFILKHKKYVSTILGKDSGGD